MQPGATTAFLAVTGIVVDIGWFRLHRGARTWSFAMAPYSIRSIRADRFHRGQGRGDLVHQSVVIDNPGANYSSAPTVTINDPTGTGATATAALDNGVISAITVKKPGSGYVTPGRHEEVR